jgi:hypothetical protein
MAILPTGEISTNIISSQLWGYLNSGGPDLFSCNLSELALTANQDPPYSMKAFWGIDTSLSIDSDSSIIAWDEGDYSNKTISVYSNVAWQTGFVIGGSGSINVVSGSGKIDLLSGSPIHVLGGNGEVIMSRTDLGDGLNHSAYIDVVCALIDPTYAIDRHRIRLYAYSDAAIDIKLDMDSAYSSSATANFRTNSVVCNDDQIDVSASASWTTTVSGSWIHLDVTSGSAGITTITVTVDSTTGERTGLVRFEILGLTAIKSTLFVHQYTSCP